MIRFLLWALPAALVWGWVVHEMQPVGVMPYDDDFGYVRSVVHTIQHGRPWTDDWLEPWAASLSVMAALVYGASGSFTFAIHGVLVACAVVAVVAVIAMFRQRGLPAGWAVVCAGCFLSFPTVLWKQTQFTSMALYTPAMLVALHATVERRWWLFALAFAVAVASRQSAIAWLALPVGAIVMDIGIRDWRRRWRDMRCSGALVLAGGGALPDTQPLDE